MRQSRPHTSFQNCHRSDDHRQAPKIFQIPLDDLDPGLPPRGTAEFEQAVIGRYALDYARAAGGRGGGR